MKTFTSDFCLYFKLQFEKCVKNAGSRKQLERNNRGKSKKSVCEKERERSKERQSKIHSNRWRNNETEKKSSYKANYIGKS